MFKLLETFRKNNLLKNPVTRQFVYYCDTGEHHFLDKLNYVGNRGVYWTHPQSSFIIRVTDDYDQCFQGNKSNDNKTCWLYFPKKIRTVMENDYSEQDVSDIQRELRNWKLIQNSPTKRVDWYAAIAARCYAWFPHVSLDQKIFAGKQVASVIHTDDAIEKLISNRQFDASAAELLNNLGLVFSQKSDQITDMHKFMKRDNIPDSKIEQAIETIEIQKEMMQLAKQLLKPNVYDLFVRGCHHYLSGAIAEKMLFQKYCRSKTIIGEQNGKRVRHRTIGVKWMLPTMMTDDAISIHLNHENPAVDLVTLIAILENDTVGYFKDKFIEFHPITFFDSNLSSRSHLDAARSFANRANEMKKVLVYVWENVPTENAKHYEHLAKYVGLDTDYCFVIGLRQANFRYGWSPQLD